MSVSHYRAVLTSLLSLALMGTAAQASDYFLVVPVKGRAVAPSAIQVVLRAAALPGGVAGEQYPGFDFNSALVVSGDAAYKSSGVTWAIASGALPAGLALGANGQLSGVPVAAGNFAFSIAANYAGQQGQQSYSLDVAGAATKVYSSIGEDGTLTLTAPVGTVFREVLFASYGTPSGLGPNYVTGECDSNKSVQMVANAFLNKSTGSIPATNEVFDDPCVGTVKVLAVVLKAY